MTTVREPWNAPQITDIGEASAAANGGTVILDGATGKSSLPAS